MLQNALGLVDRHKPYCERPLKVNVTDEPPISESSTLPPALSPPKQEEDFSKVLISVVDLRPYSCCEQCITLDLSQVKMNTYKWMTKSVKL